MSTPRTPMSTPRFVLSCLTSPGHSSSRLRTQVPLYSSPFSIASSAPPCLRPRFYCATKTLISTLKTSAFKTETLVRPVMPNLPLSSSSRLRTQVPLYSSPFSIASSGPPCLRPRFYCATKTLISTLKTSAFKTETLISTPKTTISTPESIMPTSLYLQPRGFREIRLPCFHSLSLRLTLVVSTPVVSFRSTHHSVYIV